MNLDKFLESVVGSSSLDEGRFSYLNASISHIRLIKGKLVRSALIFELGTKLNIADPLLRVIAQAVEELHLSTLVHDDMSCMDNATERRGVPTINAISGDAVALQSGNWIFADSIALILGSSVPTESEKVLIITAIVETFKRIANGQVGDKALDVNSKLDVYLDVYRDKTSAIFAEVSKLLGLLFSKHDSVLAERLFDAGEKLGIAFQLADDISEYNGGEIGEVNIIHAKGIDSALELYRRYLEDSRKLYGDSQCGVPLITFDRIEGIVGKN